ncbi:MAG: hypothetical protein M0P70_06720 [Desulfobulbaceae bacterium]|nr:hypothetical protein [Desulfobulbaceae bacterium]
MSKRCQTDRQRYYRLLLYLCCCLLGAAPQSALADSVNALLEFDYNKFDLDSMDKATGEKSETQSETWGQNYHLNLDKTIYPNLRLNFGGIFQKDETDSTINDEDRETTLTNTRPFADLTLKTPLYTAGAGYSKRDAQTKIDELPWQANINEQYNAILGWRPEGLPSFDMRLEKSDFYDKDRLEQDSTQTTASLICRYANDKLDLQYRPFMVETEDRVNNIDTKTTIHNGRLNYSDFFFNKRSSFSTTYNVSRMEIETIASGTGEVSAPLFPINGLSALDDTPTLGVLAVNPGLIDGNLTAGSGINIGLPSGGDNRAKNIGLDFATDTEVNSLRIWVDQELRGNNSAIADFFTWDVYTSSDNDTWHFERTVAPAPFDSFQNYFEINFPSVTTRYIKVVVKPLSPIIPNPGNITDIFVTEIQPYVTRPVQDVEGTNTTTTHLLNMDLRTRLMQNHELYHEFSYFLISSDPGAGERYTLSNAFSGSRQLSPVFSGNFRVAREDIKETTGDGEANAYSASLRADPLPTLDHTLVFSGRREKIGDDELDTDALFLQNRAELYKGIDAFLHGGLSRKTQNTGEQDDSTIINFGSTVVPHRTLTMTLSYTATTTDQTGGDRAEGTLKDNRMDLGAAFRPFQTVYIFASIGRVEQDNMTDNLTNYALNWSPFPYGTLQLQFSYSEDLRSEDQSKIKTIRPSLRWEIAPRISLDLSYMVTESDSVRETTDLKSMNAIVKMIY